VIALLFVLQELWVKEVRDDATRPPSLTVFPPGRPGEPEFEVTPGARGFVEATFQGKTSRIKVQQIQNRCRATLPDGKEGEVLEYRVGAEKNGRTVYGDPVVVFVSRAPTSLKEIPDPPKPVRKPTPSPADWRDHVLYFVLPDRFCDGEPANNRLGYSGYDPSNGYGAHGGDFKGLTKNLDYIRDLGATAIWITPIVQNYGTYHGYAAANFLLPDRRLGTLEEFREFVSAAHARGLYVILDVVVNHMGDLIYPTDGDSKYKVEGHPQEFYYTGKGSKVLPLPVEFRNPRWFHNYGNIDEWDDPDATPSHTQTGSFADLDDLRTEDPEVRRALIRVYQYWIAEADVDGFRVDTVKHVDRAFWQEFCPKIHAYAASIGKKNFFLFGEYYRGIDQEVAVMTGTRGGGKFLFDGMLHFPMFQTISEVFRKGAAPSQITDRMKNASLYHDDALNVLFFDNHDVPRFLHDASPEALKGALGFLFTARGIPCVYYGTEQGFRGGGDPQNREDLFDHFKSDHDLYRWIARLARLRKGSEALRRGESVSREDGGLFLFSRMTEKEEVLVAFNPSGTPRGAKRVRLDRHRSPAGCVLVDLVEGKEALGVNQKGEVELTLPAHTFRVYRRR